MIRWIPVEVAMPRIGDPDERPTADGTSVLFYWDGGVYTGWPLADGTWETAEHAIQLAGVTHWARFNEPNEDVTPAQGLPDDALLKRAVTHPAKWKATQTRWSAVGCLFSVGSTTAAQLCRRFGLDPDETRAYYEGRPHD